MINVEKYRFLCKIERSTDVGNTAQIQQHDASALEGSSMMEEILRSSGFDV